MIEITQDDGYEARRVGTSKNSTADPCVICGRACKDPKHFVRLFWGSTVVTKAEADEIIAREGWGGDLNYYPIGANCLKKHPELQPYADNARLAMNGEAPGYFLDRRDEAIAEAVKPVKPQVKKLAADDIDGFHNFLVEHAHDIYDRYEQGEIWARRIVNATDIVSHTNGNDFFYAILISTVREYVRAHHPELIEPEVEKT